MMQDKCPVCSGTELLRARGERWRCQGCGLLLSLEDSHHFEAERITNIIRRDTIKPLQDQLEQAKADIERLEAIVDKLPKTADGVPITPGMKIWLINQDEGQARFHAVDARDSTIKWWCGNCFHPEEFYSTPEAAQAANKEKLGAED